MEVYHMERVTIVIGLLLCAIGLAFCSDADAESSRATNVFRTTAFVVHLP
jgi:hypothetical protein